MNATACEMYLNVLLTINILICIKSIINLIRNDTQEVAVVAVVVSSTQAATGHDTSSASEAATLECTAI